MKPITVFLSGLGFVLVVGGIYSVVEFVGGAEGGREVTLPPGATVKDLVDALLSDAPSVVPSDTPSAVPSDTPSSVPSDMPSDVPSDLPSSLPSDYPSSVPSDLPSSLPSDLPSDVPSNAPIMVSDYPSLVPVVWSTDRETVGKDQLSALCPCFDAEDLEAINVPASETFRAVYGYCFPIETSIRIADRHRSYFLRQDLMTCGVEVEIGIGQYREELMPMTDSGFDACAQLIAIRCQESGYEISL